MTLLLSDYALLGLIGLVAGVMGGLLGLGGSIIMIPAMAVLFANRAWDNQHLFQASAMVVNIFVSLPAALRHRKNGMVPPGVVATLLPATAVAICVGVGVSNVLSGETLRRIFGVFLVYIALQSLWKAVRRAPDAVELETPPWKPGLVAVGAVAGSAGGLLGLGGGVLAVPLLHSVCKLPLKRAIAASATVMVVSSVFGAGFKVATLAEHGVSWTTALRLALCLGPLAVVGGHLGARLTRVLPIVWVRILFAVFAGMSASKLLGVW